MGDTQPCGSRPADRPTRVIMHLDMDAFYVNVELLTRPELRGQKIIVARESERSVVLSASYEARVFGVRSAMPLARAKQLCPDAIIVEPHARYRDYSQRVMEILRDLTDRVEQVSVDEAFVDLTPTLRRLGNPVTTAEAVRWRIREELNLPASAGISSTKFVAKMASAGSKPDGLWVVPPDRVQEFLDPLPVGKLWGVGPKSVKALNNWGIHTVAQLREYDLDFLTHHWGQASGTHLYRLARGIDPREVVSERVEKSIGAEHTFAHDSLDAQEIRRELFRMSLTLGQRLRAGGKMARTLSLKIRYENFETLTRSCPLSEPMDSGQAIFRAVLSRLDQLQVLTLDQQVPRAVRLIGVRAEKFEHRSDGVQVALLGQDLVSGGVHDPEQWHEAESVMDQIQGRFGTSGITPANLLPPTATNPQRPHGPGRGGS
ncbi:DNA polymerase IV [Rothia sp. LK2588]|uniref:DNA polymerase IV n=1 Tax=Rothia sp. LK2588 TaxID=3114369 RepID=UPI0034CE3774